MAQARLSGSHPSPESSLESELLAALKALRALCDTKEPRKFDEAMTWRENDTRVRALVDAVIAKAEGR